MPDLKIYACIFPSTSTPLPLLIQAVSHSSINETKSKHSSLQLAPSSSPKQNFLLPAGTACFTTTEGGGRATQCMHPALVQDKVRPWHEPPARLWDSLSKHC